MFRAIAAPLPDPNVHVMYQTWGLREVHKEEPFMAISDPQSFDKALGSGFELKVFPASEIYPTFFVPAGHSDAESGGFLIGEIETNLKLCIAEKTAKIAKVRTKYPDRKSTRLNSSHANI